MVLAGPGCVLDIFAPLAVISAPATAGSRPPHWPDDLTEVSLVLTDRIWRLLSRHFPPSPLDDEDEENDEDQEEKDDGEDDAGNDARGVRPGVLQCNNNVVTRTLRGGPSLTRINGSGLGLTLMRTEIVST